MNRLLIAMLLTTCFLSGCGDNTSWYFCSGSLCGADIDQDEDEDVEEEQPVTVTALNVARTTPEKVRSGLDLDGLHTLVEENPDLLAGWMLAGSLGLLVDDSDSEATTRFLDGNRYWLSNPPSLPAENKLLQVSLQMLTEVAAQRDGAVAAAAAASVAPVQTAAENTAESVEAQVSELAAQLVHNSQSQSQESGGETRCCSAQLLTAVSVVLCDQLAGAAQTELTTGACQSARQWFSSYLALGNL
jgi:hypothetical protein